MHRVVTPLLTLALLLSVGLLIAWGVQQRSGGPLRLRGVIGSEKAALFQDPEFQAVLRRRGLEVSVDSAGSRQIATLDLAGYDFAFPSSAPAAEKIRRDQGVGAGYNAFFTPMALASWSTLTSLLEQNGLAENRGGYHQMALKPFLALSRQGTRWADLRGSAASTLRRPLLIATTDPRHSNSAAMFLALAAHLENGDAVLSSAAQARQVLPALEPLFLRQGFQDRSSAGPFETYLLLGMGAAPLVLIYESQYLETLIRGRIRPEMRLIYPHPNVLSTHVLLPLSEGGDRLGRLFADPEVQAIVVRHGFRVADPHPFERLGRTLGFAPPEPGELVELPRYEVLEGLIAALEQRYEP